MGFVLEVCKEPGQAGVKSVNWYKFLYWEDLKGLQRGWACLGLDQSFEKDLNFLCSVTESLMRGGTCCP